MFIVWEDESMSNAFLFWNHFLTPFLLWIFKLLYFEVFEIADYSVENDKNWFWKIPFTQFGVRRGFKRVFKLYTYGLSLLNRKILQFI